MIFGTEIETFSTHSLALKEKTADPYLNSPFRVYKEMSSKKKGKYFEMIVAEYFERQGYGVTKAENSDHDRIIKRKKTEIKGSFLWGEGTHFRWQQIRTGQDYDVICFVAIYPDRIEFHGATKEEVCYNVEVQDTKGNWIYNQHGGKKVNSGAFVIDGFPEDFSWFRSFEEIIND
jgi:hypothetical protein